MTMAVLLWRSLLHSLELHEWQLRALHGLQPWRDHQQRPLAAARWLRVGSGRLPPQPHHSAALCHLGGCFELPIPLPVCCCCCWLWPWRAVVCCQDGELRGRREDQQSALAWLVRWGCAGRQGATPNVALLWLSFSWCPAPTASTDPHAVKYLLLLSVVPLIGYHTSMLLNDHTV